MSRLIGRVQNENYTAEKKSANLIDVSIKGWHAGASISARRNDGDGPVNDNIDLSIFVNHGSGGPHQFADRLIAEFTETTAEDGTYKRTLKIPMAVMLHPDPMGGYEYMGAYLTAQDAMKAYQAYVLHEVKFGYSPRDKAYYGFSKTTWAAVEDRGNVDDVTIMAEVKIIETAITQEL